jgi:hypothetical protein
MSQSTIIAIFATLCPWLMLLRGLQLLAGRCKPAWRGWGRLSLLAVLSLGVLAVPVRGISIAGWVRGINANFSIPFTALLAAAIWEAEFGRRLLAARDWTVGWAFGALAGLGLYPLALGWGRFDPYEWGWAFSPLFVATALLTAGLLWRQSRFGLMLLFAIFAFNLRLLESTNYWDYLVDPLYCVVSVAALAWRLLPRARGLNQ